MAFLKKRFSGWGAQYISGLTLFPYRRLKVNGRTCDPHPETISPS